MTLSLLKYLLDAFDVITPPPCELDRCLAALHARVLFNDKSEKYTTGGSGRARADMKCRMSFARLYLPTSCFAALKISFIPANLFFLAGLGKSCRVPLKKT